MHVAQIPSDSNRGTVCSIRILDSYNSLNQDFLEGKAEPEVQDARVSAKLITEVRFVACVRFLNFIKRVDLVQLQLLTIFVTVICIKKMVQICVITTLRFPQLLLASFRNPKFCALEGHLLQQYHSQFRVLATKTSATPWLSFQEPPTDASLSRTLVL